MVELMEKMILGVITAVVVLYILINAFVPAVNDADLTNVSGSNYQWIIGIVIIVIFVGFAIASYKHFLGKGHHK